MNKRQDLAFSPRRKIRSDVALGSRNRCRKSREKQPLQSESPVEVVKHQSFSTVSSFPGAPYNEGLHFENSSSRNNNPFLVTIDDSFWTEADLSERSLGISLGRFSTRPPVVGWEIQQAKHHPFSDSHGTVPNNLNHFSPDLKEGWNMGTTIIQQPWTNNVFCTPYTEGFSQGTHQQAQCSNNDIVPLDYNQINDFTTNNNIAPQNASVQLSSGSHKHTKSLLHKIICLANPNSHHAAAAIRKIIEMDPMACSRPANIYTTKKVWCPKSSKLVDRKSKEPYAYPLNLAIHKKLDEKILIMIAEAAPEVMMNPDGSRQERSLSILLRSYPTKIRLIDRLLQADSNGNGLQVAKTVDRYQATPLHVACGAGASLDVVQHLYMLAPESITIRTLQGDIPWDVCRKSTRCSVEVVDFLSFVSFRK